MNELLPEYPKKIVVSCYCPLGAWSVRKIPNESLCKNCAAGQAKLDAQYYGLVADKK